MSTKVKSPNQKGNGFIWAVGAIIVIAVIVVAYIIFTNRGNHEVDVDRVPTAMSVAVEDDAVHVTAEDPAKLSKDTPKVELYEDYLCPHCGDLAVADESDLRDAVEKGDVDLKIRTMTFMDRGDGEGTSHKFAAAAMAMAQSGDADLYWNFRNYLMAHQGEVARTWDTAELVGLAESLDAPEHVVKEIEQNTYGEDARELSVANEDRLRETEQGVASPRIFVDGEEIELSQDWVEHNRR